MIENPTNAVASARRLRGHPVYKDTISYWSELLQDARRARQDLSPAQTAALETAIAALESELADRAR